MCANLYAFVFTFDTDVRDLVSNRKIYCSYEVGTVFVNNWLQSWLRVSKENMELMVGFMHIGECYFDGCEFCCKCKDIVGKLVENDKKSLGKQLRQILCLDF